MRNGSIRDSAAVTAAIEEFVRAERLQGAEAATAVPGRIIMIKTLELPAMPGTELDTAVEFEAMRLIPENLSDVFWDYHVMRPAEGEQKLSVLLTAARKPLVRSYMDAIAHAGLIPTVIDVDYFALHNLCSHLYPNTADQTVCLVHAGESITTITLSCSREPLFLSSETEIAGGFFTRTLARDLAIAVEEAEVMKVCNGSGAASRAFTRALHPLCREFVHELDRQLSRFAALIGNRTIERLFVCGGASKLQSLQETLLEHPQHGIGRYEPLLRNSLAVAGNVNELPPDFAVIGGLALRWS